VFLRIGQQWQGNQTRENFAPPRERQNNPEFIRAPDPMGFQACPSPPLAKRGGCRRPFFGHPQRLSGSSPPLPGIRDGSQHINSRGRQKPPTLDEAEKKCFGERTVVERINSRLKDSFGRGSMWVKRHAKVLCHTSFAVRLSVWVL
jgi:hypothetical protein